GTVRLAVPADRGAPAGLNASEVTGPAWPVMGRPIGWPVATAHKWMVPSALALARVSPSGLNATEEAVGVAMGLQIGRPVAASHTQTLPWMVPLASAFPSAPTPP